MSFFVDKALDAIKEKLTEVEREKDLLLGRLEAQADAFRQEKLRMLEEFAEERKRDILTVFVEKANGIFEYLMAMVLLAVKDILDDPYMPRWFKSWVDTVIDAWWPDVKSEVRDSVISELAEKDPLHHGRPPCCGCGWSPLSFIRYHLFPYDRNGWRKIRDPFWWLCFLLSIVPVYGVAQIYYMVLFFFLDHGDAFQMHDYVVTFKYLQFISIGFLSAIVGSVQYYICTSEEPNSCDANAPRVELWLMIVFVLQIIFAWAGFAFGRCAEKKGGLQYQRSKLTVNDYHTRKERHEGFANVLRGDAMQLVADNQAESDALLEENARWRLMKFLIYDLIVFIVCIALVIWATWFTLLDEDARVQNNSEGANQGNWKYSATLFWIRGFYGIMSLPWVFLKLPGISAVFTHAKPTGYNPYGNTVPYLGKEEDGPVPWEPERPYSDPELQAFAVRQRRCYPTEPIVTV